MIQVQQARRLCLFGDVVTEDGTVTRRQYVLLAGGRIRSVGAELPAGVDAPDYTLAADELIFPSFLDLHTHSSYNMLPLWHSPYWAWDNRFQWRANAQYKQAIGGLNAAIGYRYGHGSKIYTAFNAYSELMAVAGGTTVLQENAHLDASGFPSRDHVLIRSTGSPADMGLADNEQIVSITDFYEPDPYYAPRNPVQDTSGWKVKPASKGLYGGATYVADFALSVTGTRTRGTIVHLAEGRSGYLQTTLGPDPYTRAEFDTFRGFITDCYERDDIAKVRDARLLLIHGCGMNTIAASGNSRAAAGTRRSSETASTIAFLKTYGIGVIWSPVSNLLLYQDTTNVLPLLDAGIPVVLGTDWTPSGSKTVWEEAKFAAAFLEARGWDGDVDRTCFRSITSVAADALGLPLGRVRAGNFADLVIVRRPAGAKRGDALATFRRATDADVRCVFVGGVPLYGDADLLKSLGVVPQPLPGEGPASVASAASVASTKAYALPAQQDFTPADLAAAVGAATHVLGRNRAMLLAADDDAYRARIDELLDWVLNFGTKKGPGPNPKPVPPPPTGLAPGEAEWIYNPSLNPAGRIDPAVADLLGRAAACRDVGCEVPKRHPYYHAQVLTQAGDSYGFRVPCMPVVPVLTQRKQLFIMGDYPTAKFTARSTNSLPVFTTSPDQISQANAQLDALLHDAAEQPHAPPHLLETYIEELDDVVRGAFARPDINLAAKRDHPDDTPPRSNQFFVPVADVFAPMQDANYFDGYKVRNVAAGVFLHDNYLKPVGIDLESQVWLTNMIKCFLFHDSMAASYQALGWTDVRVEASYSELLPIGKVCSQWINEEVQVCDPRLVLTVGKPPCTLLHNVPFSDAALQGRVYNELLGVLLPAGNDRLETAIAKKLQLESSDPPPFPPDAAPAGRSVRRTTGVPTPAAPVAAAAAAARPAPVPVSIGRIAPWSRYNVFHMLHPQAVMMSQTAVSTALVQAVTFVLGAKANGMTSGELNAAVGAYLKTHTVAQLIRALPYGQRDVYHTNAALLERHAVCLANLADTLAQLKLASAGAANGDAVLAAQARELADTFHLADSAADELKRLRQQRQVMRDRIAGFLHGRSRR